MAKQDAGKLKDQAAKALAKGKLDKALEKYMELEKIAKTDLRIPQKIAEILAKMGEKDKAIEKYKESAGQYHQKGFLVQAIAIYKVVLDMAPDDPDAKKALSELTDQRTGPDIPLPKKKKLPEKHVPAPQKPEPKPEKPAPPEPEPEEPEEDVELAIPAEPEEPAELSDADLEPLPEDDEPAIAMDDDEPAVALGADEDELNMDIDLDEPAAPADRDGEEIPLGDADEEFEAEIEVDGEVEDVGVAPLDE